MARGNGRAPRGERPVAAVPHGRRRATAFAGALRAGGFTAPAVIDGAMDGPTSLAGVRRFPAPTLRGGGVPVADNPGVHEAAGAREAVEATGAALLHLPPRSPDLDPIGLAFGKLEGLLRAAAERTADGPWNAVGTPLDRFSPDGRRRHFRHRGHAQSA